MAKKRKKGSLLIEILRPLIQLIATSKDLGMVFFLMAILSIIIVPLPSGVLDFMLTISIAVSILVLMIAIYIPKPTDLTTFPTLILVITLFRLSLNIATTRMILSEGHNGVEAVSQIISAFGNFVVGGNLVIGIIIFIILVLINFMVITKGSGRVAEVAARFTLDAMPGKQMAIDADLNAGLINEAEAKQRRAEILQEANFYGAMDGSSKFVKGDAVAGIIITIVNIIGGFLIGVFQFDMSISESASTFTVLTIGDGLVSQIPALILSTATGIIITRASGDKENFASGSISQLSGDYKVLILVGGILFLFALVPGLPTIPLGGLGFVFLTLGYLLYKHEVGELGDVFENINKISTKITGEDLVDTEAYYNRKKPKRKSEAEIQKEEQAALEEILKVEMLELTLGYQLIKLADIEQGGDLLDRIRSMRRKIATDFGFIMPQVRIRDNLQLNPKSYQILIKGVEVAEAMIEPDKFLAMDSGMVTDEIPGDKTIEPAFGLEAIWIEKSQKEEAIMNGYTVVDPSTVISTHLSEIVKKYAEEFLTRQEIQGMIDKVKAEYPIIVEEVLKVAPIGLIQRVLRALIHEKVPLTDMVTILEAITDVAEVTKSVDILVEQVRARLSRTISSLYRDENGKIRLITFATDVEQKLLNKVVENEGYKQLNLTADEINKLVQTVSEESANLIQMGIIPVVIIVDPMIRRPLSEIFERFNLDIIVLSHAEIDTNSKFEILGSITIDNF
ncbi:MAG TPA: flagellar biosynthesis protein FlhA [Campylobacterales bacterium]|nr:flagellar biosynthesis protein FlhA [Campylobacterales bacterium]